MPRLSDVVLQREHYAASAGRYDEAHGVDAPSGEHALALAFMAGAIDHLRLTSVLDVGSGTGRVLRFVDRRCPGLHVVGVEPVQELREQGYLTGVPAEKLVDGDATALGYGDGSFDLVCAFGVLHHVREPEKAVSEMLRVARTAIFISDSNNFGQGTALVRMIKQTIDALGLWPLANFIKTRGRGYTVSQGDGVSYSYSVFSSYRQIRKQCQRVHLLDTAGGSGNLYRTAGHVALLAIKNAGAA